ncbi:hypothetical protein D3P07_15625 [Paenibacillus sp. 1011MAR3C5]|uniref:C39 family peptidase n=1 Tax=Paenibacillus sp. 1011MAR3C5 TaxID=1675787 RepID=UPI000E6D5769|nr:C39 family peptidase [Paenibacillus sp. 1011MAR3C5]RJE87730.1 hypothetical protein D3P07_15625 [Paenibacillus sp. 1011MAR3C5]
MFKSKMYFALLLTFVLLLVTPFSTLASSDTKTTELNKSEYGRLLQSAWDTANEYVEIVKTHGDYKPWSSASVTYRFPLFNFDNEVTSFYFDVRNANGDAGYLIVRAIDPLVIESAREGTGPYTQKDSNDSAIYLGPLQYYLKLASNGYYDIRQGLEISKRDLKISKSLNSVKVGEQALTSNTDSLFSLSTTSSIVPASIHSYSSKILSDVPDFQWRAGCSPTSFANIIWYYRYSHGYTSLLQSTTSSSTLIDVLAGSSYMNTNVSSGGTTDWNDRVTGMKKFWNDRGWNVTVTRTSPSFATHRSQITNNRPTIINTTGDATYGNHDMTGVGYEEYQQTSTLFQWHRYVIVRDTWNTTPKSVYLYISNLSWNETVTVVPGSAI